MTAPAATTERALATCRKKIAYLSRRCAENAAVLLALKHHGAPLTAYDCPHCPDWHLTSSVDVLAAAGEPVR